MIELKNIFYTCSNIIMEYYKQVYKNKFNNLDEVDKFLKRFKQSMLIQTE